MSALIVDEARRWIGTPYRHQAAVRGAGCDCLGLLRGVWCEVYGAEPEVPPAYTPDWDEVTQADVLMAAARRHLEPQEMSEIASGDVLLFRMRQGAVAKHLGIASGAASFIHAYSGHGVIENALSDPWRRRIVGVYSFPTLD
ncbi:NlpC/P60 family protein [Rhodobacteraceae bacterium]|nr:NlpC/P60 family protein [Paracoccaceae bacterium]